MKKMMSLNLPEETANIEEELFCTKLAAKLSVAQTGNGMVELTTPYRMHHAYVWQIALAPLPQETNDDQETGWKHIAVTSRASYKVENLDSGKTYWFRVASIGKNGRNPWSVPQCETITE